MKPLRLLATVLAALAVTAGTTSSGHKITVTFDYNFTRLPPCSAKVKDEKKCVDLFVVYDASAGWNKRTQLMTIPVPSGAQGTVKGISGTTPLLAFEPGKHLIAVVAQTPKGVQSDPNRCMIWVQIPK